MWQCMGAFRFLGTLVVAVTVIPLLAGAEAADEWTPLFNGKDLSAWDTWLGSPGAGEKRLGLNNDPMKVYSVVEMDGQPAIRNSGEVLGALTTKEEFGNYHLKLEFKWGEKRWPPRANQPRCSGLLYHSVGKFGANGGPWLKSVGFHVQEGSLGDFWSVDGAMVDVEGERKDDQAPIKYKKGGMKYTVPSKDYRGRQIIKDVNYEKKTGEWNTIELLAVGQTSVHIVNGKANMVLANARYKEGDQEIPLMRGKIQLRSELAETYYRNIVIKPLRKLPDEYAR